MELSLGLRSMLFVQEMMSSFSPLRSLETRPLMGADRGSIPLDLTNCDLWFLSQGSYCLLVIQQYHTEFDDVWIYFKHHFEELYKIRFLEL